MADIIKAFMSANKGSQKDILRSSENEKDDSCGKEPSMSQNDKENM